MNQDSGTGRGGRGAPGPDQIREEAERLVATGLAAVSMVADRIGAPTRERGGSVAAGYDALGDVLFGPSGHRRHNVANDSPECCRCPLCRVISAARDPDPRLAERVATGVGTVAGGAARVLRGLAGAAGSFREATRGEPTLAPSRPEPTPSQPSGPQPSPAGAGPRHTDPWAAATAEPAAPPFVPGAAPAPVEPPHTTGPVPVPQPVEAPSAAAEPTGGKPPAAKAATKPTVTSKAVAKKAVAKKAVAKKSATKPAVTKKAVVKKAVVKKAVVKKAVANPAVAEPAGSEPGAEATGEAGQ